MYLTKYTEFYETQPILANKIDTFKKTENNKLKQDLSGRREVGTSGRWEDIKKECRKVNVVAILCTHV
jgi:hypothetical protein